MNTTFNNEPKPKYWNNQLPPDFSKLILNNEKFIDPYFPPTDSSLYSLNDSGIYTDPLNGENNSNKKKSFFGDNKVVWHRLTDIQPEWSLFGSEINPEQINQGYIGNCYFLSLLSSLAHYPPIIKHIFKTINFNINGFYEVQLFIDGEWQCVFVDDNFPYIEKSSDKTSIKVEGQFAFSRPKVNEIWVMILEKVWAKINKGYSNISGGNMLQVIHILTGFSAYTLSNTKLTNRDNEIVNEKLYFQIEQELQNNAIVNASTISEQSIEDKNLLALHSYSIIEAQKIEESKSNIYLLKLRNPWGSNGIYNDFGSVNQKSISEYKTYNETAADGTFWIDIDSYMKYFQCCYISRLLFNSYCKYYTFNNKKYFKYPIVFNMTLKEKSTVSFNIIFKDFKLKKMEQSVIIPTFFVLSSWDKKTNFLKEVYSKYQFSNNLNFISDLEEGNYIIWIYIPLKKCDYILETDFVYSLIISSSKMFNMKLIDIDKQSELISRIALDKSKIVPPVEENTKKKDTKAAATNKQGNDEISIDSDSNIINGLFTVFIENKTKDKWGDVTLKFTLTKTELLYPYNKSNEIQLNIPPNKTKVIIGYYIDAGEVGLSVEMKSTLEKKRIVIPQDNLLEIRKQYFKFNLLDNNTIKEQAPLVSNFMYISSNEQEKVENPYIKGPKINILNKYKGKDAIIQKIFFSLDMPSFKPLLNTMYPKEMNILLSKYKVFTLTPEEEYWTYHENNEGIYVIVYTFKTERGIFFKRITNRENENDGYHYLKYIGYLKDGKMDGLGQIMDHELNIIYEGYFEKGMKNGYGKLLLENKDIYEGYFKNDLFDGKGKYTYANGSYWEGSFIKGVQNGVGTLIDKKVELSNDKKNKSKLNKNNNKNNKDKNKDILKLTEKSENTKSKQSKNNIKKEKVAI